MGTIGPFQPPLLLKAGSLLGMRRSTVVPQLNSSFSLWTIQNPVVMWANYPTRRRRRYNGLYPCLRLPKFRV